MQSLKFSDCVPKKLLQVWRSFTNPIDQKTFIAGLAYAKYKEVSELISEVQTLNRQESFSPRFFYPTKLGEKFHEFIQIFTQTETFKNLSVVDKIAFINLQSLQGHELTHAFSAQKFQGQSLSHLLQSLLKGNRGSTLIQLSKQDPFYISDLVVFTDDYYGPLPQNGIHQRDFLQMKSIYLKCFDGSLGLKTEGTPAFKLRMRFSIKKLMTRQLGRNLIQRALGQNWLTYLKDSITFQNKPLTIKPDLKKSTASSSKTTGRLVGQISIPTSHEYIVAITDRLALKTFTDISGELYKLRLSDTLLLAHELIHIAHYRSNIKWTPLNPAEIVHYTNPEEKVTITGSLNGETADPISENSIRESFGFYPRKFHAV